MLKVKTKQLLQEKLTFKNAACIKKEETRVMFFNDLSKLGITDLRYVGLPALSPILENKLMEEYYLAYSMYFAEMDKDVYKLGRKLYDDIPNVSYVNTNILQAKIPFRANAVWLDLCSVISKQTFEGLMTFLNNNELEQRGLFALTIQGSREQPQQQEYFAKLQKAYLGTEFKSVNYFRHLCFPHILRTLFITHAKCKITFMRSHPYHSKSPNYKSGGQNMHYYSFTWHKL